MKKIILCAVVLLTGLCGVARANGIPLSVRYMEAADACMELDRSNETWKTSRCDKLESTLSREEHIGICKELRTGMLAPKCSYVIGSNDPKWVEDYKYRLAHNDSVAAVPFCTDLGPAQYQPAWELLKCEELLQNEQSQQAEEIPQKAPVTRVTPAENQSQTDCLSYVCIGLCVFFVCGVALLLLLRARKKNSSHK